MQFSLEDTLWPAVLSLIGYRLVWFCLAYRTSIPLPFLQVYSLGDYCQIAELLDYPAFLIPGLHIAEHLPDLGQPRDLPSRLTRVIKLIPDGQQVLVDNGNRVSGVRFSFPDVQQIRNLPLIVRIKLIQQGLRIHTDRANLPHMLERLRYHKRSPEPIRILTRGFQAGRDCR